MKAPGVKRRGPIRMIEYLEQNSDRFVLEALSAPM